MEIKEVSPNKKRNLAMFKNYDMELPSKVPQATGYRILLLPLKPKEKTSGGILLPEQSQDVALDSMMCFYVVSMGSACYCDTAKYGPEPWCLPGDWVISSKHGGVRTMVKTDSGLWLQMRIINDDEIFGTTDDPEVLVKQR